MAAKRCRKGTKRVGAVCRRTTKVRAKARKAPRLSGPPELHAREATEGLQIAKDMITAATIAAMKGRCRSVMTRVTSGLVALGSYAAHAESVPSRAAAQTDGNVDQLKDKAANAIRACLRKDV